MIKNDKYIKKDQLANRDEDFSVRGGASLVEKEKKLTIVELVKL